MIRAALLLLVGLAGGLALARGLSPSHATPTDRQPAPHTTDTTEAPAQIVVRAGRIDEAALRNVVRDVLRDELHNVAPPEPRPSRPVTQGPTAANEAAFAQGGELLEAARARRRWTSDDRVALRQLLPQMTAEQRDDILQTLFPALNRGELTTDFRGVPF
jgi:hypothetical protein